MKKLVIGLLVATALVGCSSTEGCPQALDFEPAAAVAAVPMPAPAPRPPAPAQRIQPARPAPAPKQQAPRPAAPWIQKPPPPRRSFVPPAQQLQQPQRPTYVNNHHDPVPYMWLLLATHNLGPSHNGECR
ncbi:hypothetical protein [Arthrobacter sp. UYCu712]|uniref:hypothetical protein n=1 Tax=Arthrobacter sp. UYCu712 TaxID=3156340 RepID=UPI0033952D7F